MSEFFVLLCILFSCEQPSLCMQDIRAQAQVAHAHKRLYFTLRGPRAVLSSPNNPSTRLSPYMFSTHIRSDHYSHVLLKDVLLKDRAYERDKVGTSGDALVPVRLAVLDCAHNSFFEGSAANEHPIALARLSLHLIE